MRNRYFLTLVAALALALAALHSPRVAEAALGEPLQAGSTGWWWYYGQTPAQVSSLLTANNGRLVSLRVQSTNPLLLDVAMVQNTGSQAKTWWWYYGLTAQQLGDQTTANDARIVSIEPYMSGGSLRFAAIMLHNVGADFSGWWWYYGLTPDQVKQKITENNARLIDLRRYDAGGSSAYSVVMVQNSGSNQSGWWWYYNITSDQVGSLLAQNNAYLISLDPNPRGTTFNVIMNSNPGGFRWWWYFGQTAGQLAAVAQSNSARIFDVKTYVVNGQQRFAALLVNDVWNAQQAQQGACDRGVLASWRATPPAVGLGSASARSSYDTTFRALMNKYGVPGGAVAVMNKGRLVLARGYGFSDLDNSLIAHPDSLFRIASLSKQITSAAVLKLAAQNRLSLSANPFALLGLSPDPAGAVNPVLSQMTVAELLQHTGGWSRETGCSNCSAQGDPMFESEQIAAAQKAAGPPSCNRIIQYMLTQSVMWTPGKVFDYSNFGYCVLGSVIERVTGQSYANYVAGNILNPAGAGAIVQGQTVWPADREVVYYDFPGAGAGTDVFVNGLNAFSNPYGNFYLEAMAAHGAWVASPVDLLRFQGALDGRRGPALLDAASLAKMTANPGAAAAVIQNNRLVTIPQTASWYGMGWSVNTAGNWWHNGSLPGTTTEQVHAANGFGWAAFFNSRPSNADGFLNDLDAALWTAFNGTSSFGDADVFDQYGGYTNWMTSVAYQSLFDSQRKVGRYPSRIEGYNSTGAPLYRAAFAPFHGSAWESRHGLDCTTYQSRNAALLAQGYEAASLQSFVSSDGTRRYQATWVKP